MPKNKEITLTSLINAVGDDKAKFQVLLQSMTNITTSKNVSKITFETDAINATQVFTNDVPLVGLVVWLPKEDVDTFLKK